MDVLSVRYPKIRDILQRRPVLLHPLLTDWRRDREEERRFVVLLMAFFTCSCSSLPRVSQKSFCSTIMSKLYYYCFEETWVKIKRPSFNEKRCTGINCTPIIIIMTIQTRQTKFLTRATNSWSTSDPAVLSSETDYGTEERMFDFSGFKLVSSIPNSLHRFLASVLHILIRMVRGVRETRQKC